MTLTGPGPSQELDFNRNRKILVFGHGLRGLTMDHDTAVAESPTRAVRHLFAHKTVFDAQPVIREGEVIEEMPKPLVELVVVFVVDHLDQAIFDAKCITEIIVRLVAPDLWDPAIEVCAIEQGDPVFLRGDTVEGDTRDEHKEEDELLKGFHRMGEIRARHRLRSCEFGSDRQTMSRTLPGRPTARLWNH